MKKIALFMFGSLFVAAVAFAADTGTGSDTHAGHAHSGQTTGMAKEESWTGKITQGSTTHDYVFNVGSNSFELTGPQEASLSNFLNKEVTLTGTMNKDASGASTIQVSKAAPASAHGSTTTMK